MNTELGTYVVQSEVSSRKRKEDNCTVLSVSVGNCDNVFFEGNRAGLTEGPGDG